MPVGLGQAQGNSQAARESHVGRQLNRLAEESSYVLDKLELLESRLGNILRPIDPSPIEEIGRKDISVPLVVHAEKLSEAASMIHSAGQRVESMLNRLEL